MTQQFDLARLQALLDSAPPRPRFLSWSLFSPERAFSLKTARTYWLVAHPLYWKKVLADPKVIEAENRKSLFGIAGIEIEEVDALDTDSKALAERKYAARDDLARDLGVLFDQALGSRSA